MQNFFCNEEFFYDLGDLIDSLDVEDINNLPDDYKLECDESILEPVVVLSADWILDRINERRFPEDDDELCLKIRKSISDNIDFEKLNSSIPMLYYGTRKKFVVTKQDLVDWDK